MIRNKGSVLTKMLAAITALVIVAFAVYYGMKWKQNHDAYIALLTQEQDFNKKIGHGAFPDADVDRFVSVSDSVLDGRRPLSDADLDWCLNMIRQGQVVPNSPEDRRLSYRFAKLGRTLGAAIPRMTPAQKERVYTVASSNLKVTAINQGEDSPAFDNICLMEDLKDCRAVPLVRPFLSDTREKSLAAEALQKLQAAGCKL